VASSPNSVWPGDRRRFCSFGTGVISSQATPRLDNVISRLTLIVQFPMPGRIGIGRVENRPLEEALVHADSLSYCLSREAIIFVAW
jgi:hypothetical protein